MLYICIRKTTQWADEEIFLEQLQEKFKTSVEAWNQTFDMPYHLFRDKIKMIAQSNLAMVNDSVVTTFENVPDGGLILPIDDDDWLAPNLVSKIQTELEEGVTGYHWIHDRLSVPRPRNTWSRFSRFVAENILGKSSSRYIFQTNNYMFVKGRVPLGAVRFHTRANRYFLKNFDRTKYIHNHLSVWNQTIASKISMGWPRRSISSEMLKKNYYLYKELYDTVELPNHPWSVPYVVRMRELMEELRIR